MEKINFQRRENFTIPLTTALEKTPEEVRREIQKLEGQIEAKLASLSSLTEKIEQWATEGNEFEMNRSNLKIEGLDELKVLIDQLEALNSELSQTNISQNIIYMHKNHHKNYTNEWRQIKVEAKPQFFFSKTKPSFLFQTKRQT
jgi:chromosome segregation ATPase